MVLHGHNQILPAECLPPEFHNNRPTVVPVARTLKVVPEEEPLPQIVSLEEAVNDFERKLVMRALSEARGVQTRAAELLGTTRRILKYRMDKLNISEPTLVTNQYTRTPAKISEPAMPAEPPVDPPVQQVSPPVEPPAVATEPSGGPGPDLPDDDDDHTPLLPLGIESMPDVDIDDLIAEPAADPEPEPPAPVEPQPEPVEKETQYSVSAPQEQRVVETQHKTFYPVFGSAAGGVMVVPQFC
jgi:hypothetical protein